MQLREYQTAACEHVRSIRGQYRLALEAPTGAGKSLLMAELLRDPKRHLVLTHRRVLLEQLARTLESCGIRFGYQASGYKADPKAPVQLSMVQTAIRRKPIPDIDMVHVDEIHCMRGPKYKEKFEHYYANGANILGYTATPSDLGDMVDDVYRVATVPDLISQGYLCPPKVFGCGQPDVRKLEKLRRDAQGEYLAGDVSKLVKPHVIFGSVLEHYKRLSNGLPFVLFADCVKSSKWWAQHLTGKDVPTAHIDGDDIWVDGQSYKSDSAKRREVFERLESGELAGVSNRFVLREGFDAPTVGHIILTCPMALRKTYTQACGRGLRPHPIKDHCIIQDHSGSSIDHPSLDSAEPWDWESAPGLSEKIRISEMRNDVLQEPVVCPKCMHVRPAGDTCPMCGHRYEKRSRFVLQMDGTLKLIEGKTYHRKKETYRPGDEKIAERLYYAARNSGRTAEQCIAYYAYKNNWRWLPRNLPFFPKSEGDFFIPWRDVPKERLIPQKKSRGVKPGEKYNGVTVLRPTDKRTRGGGIIWVCRCPPPCGREFETRAANIKNGNTRSCGCKNIARTREMGRNRKTHSMAKSALYNCWNVARYNIGMGPKWTKFENFHADMGDKPHPRAQLRRKDTSKPHGPDNSYWKLPKNC